MRIRELAIAAAIGVAACIHNPTPSDRGPEEAATDGHGSTIVVRIHGQFPIGGELIAIDARNVYVLVGATLAAVPRDRIESLDLFEYQSTTGVSGLWGTLGTLSTISHGFYLVLSAPVWMVTAIWTTAAESRAPRVQYPDRPMADLVPWARFPQGLPPGVTGETLIRDSRPRIQAPGATPEMPPPAPPPAPPAPPP